MVPSYAPRLLRRTVRGAAVAPHLASRRPGCALGSVHSQQAHRGGQHLKNIFQRKTFPLPSEGSVLLFSFQRVTWSGSLLQSRRNSSGVPWNCASVLYQATSGWPHCLQDTLWLPRVTWFQRAGPRWNMKAVQAPKTAKGLSVRQAS